MDPVSQGVLGASLPQAASKHKHIALAGILGFFGGLAPDLDVLIRSSSDPLLFLEYHRQFTHSLFFIPIGGLICALVLHLLLARRRGLAFRHTWLYCTLGYATHALLDACTTYGTQLLWPFSSQRFAWNTISIIDPLFTVPIAVLVIASYKKRDRRFARIALAWALIYQGIGLIQRDRAIEAGETIAAMRGHEPVRLEAKPSFGNLLVWKIVYETQQRFYVDAVRVGIDSKAYNGQSILKLDIARDFPWLDHNSQQARDIERFRWFSNGYIALSPQNPHRVIDVRYSMVPNQVDALWSIELSPDADPLQHANYTTHRDTAERGRRLFWQMLANRAHADTIL